MCNHIVDGGYKKFSDELDKLEGDKYINVFLKLAKIVNANDTDIAANQKLINLFNEKLNLCRK
jgi:hypothetical protein